MLLAVISLLVPGSCSDDEALVPEPVSGQKAELDPCNGRCTEVELCAPEGEGEVACARICANQLHCWSGCCLPLGDSGYNVCRPTERCFPDR